jgi:nanoRNase/pAp phosphatase (c-di-AMP/oligoRNAs hydrolase)
MDQTQLAALFRTVDAIGRCVILSHNDPDPDGIASAVALRHLMRKKAGITCPIAYQGVIGRAENRALVRYLGHPLQPFAELLVQRALPVAVVDGQPGVGNVTLPQGSQVAIVIDHHALREATRHADFCDVRSELGATSTILTEYLQAAQLEPPQPVATALFYGIKTNTMALGRDSAPADVSAYSYLQSRIDHAALARIEYARVPAEYFRTLDTALAAARVYGGAIVAFIGAMAYPDMAAEMADMLMRLEQAQWAVCMGQYRDLLILSVRTRSSRWGAEAVVQAIVRGEGAAGGHGKMAGGHVALEGRDPVQLADLLIHRTLQALQIPPETRGRPLI